MPLAANDSGDINNLKLEVRRSIHPSVRDQVCWYDVLQAVFFGISPNLQLRRSWVQK